jgi:hypothetical protein
MFKQLWLLTGNEVYQQFTYVNPISQPSSSTPLLLGVSSPIPHGNGLPEYPGATLSEELHTPPLPVTHVFLGYCWSYSRFTILAVQLTRPNNDTPSFSLVSVRESVADDGAGIAYITPPNRRR